MQSGQKISTATYDYLDWDVAIKKIDRYVQLGNKLLNNQQYYQASEYFNDAKSTYDRARTPDRCVLANIFYKLALCKKGLNNKNKAKTYVEDSLAIYQGLREHLRHDDDQDKKSRLNVASSNYVLVATPSVDKNKASQCYYQAGKLYLSYFNDDRLANDCFMNALRWLGFQMPEKTSPFFLNSIYLPVLKIDIQRTRLLIKQRKLDEALYSIEQGLRIVKDMLDISGIIIKPKAHQYKQLQDDLITLLRPLAPEHPLLHIRIVDTPFTLFGVAKTEPDMQQQTPSVNVAMNDHPESSDEISDEERYHDSSDSEHSLHNYCCIA